MRRRYRTLGFIGVIFKILGVLLFAGGLLLILFTLITYISARVEDGAPFDFALLLALLTPGLAALFAGLVNYGTGQLIDLLRDIELNTRAQAGAALRTSRATNALVRQMQMQAQSERRRAATQPRPVAPVVVNTPVPMSAPMPAPTPSTVVVNTAVPAAPAPGASTTTVSTATPNNRSVNEFDFEV